MADSQFCVGPNMFLTDAEALATSVLPISGPFCLRRPYLICHMRLSYSCGACGDAILFLAACCYDELHGIPLHAVAAGRPQFSLARRQTAGFGSWQRGP
jgi:hypothetical protein